MKRVYRNSDITFNLTVNEFPFNSDIIKNVEFKFFTKNEKNFISKTKADIVNGSLILEWNELAKLEEGIMYYTYNVSITDSSFSDNENNTVDKVLTDYFIMSGKTGIDFVQDSAVWGLIEGDVANQKDLVAYIDLTVKNLSNTYYNKTEIDNKENLQNQDITAKLVGKVDKSEYQQNQSIIKSSINDKADTVYVNNELQKKSDKEYIATLENRLKAVEEDLNLGFIALEDGSGRIIPE